MLATRLTSPQNLVNQEYARLTGDPPVEAKAGDGDAGSGDEGGKKTPNLSWMLQSRLQKLVDRTNDEWVSSYIFIGGHVLTSILRWTGYLGGIHGTLQQEIVAWLLQGDQTSAFRENLCTRLSLPTVNIILPLHRRKSETEGMPYEHRIF